MPNTFSRLQWAVSGSHPRLVREAQYFHRTTGILIAPDLAELIVFLLSDKASYISGSLHPVDGGWLNSPPGATPWR